VLAYRVDNTDNLESIASQFSTTPARIREMNHLQSTTKLNAGDEIMVPALGAVSVGN
jgi:spore germination protein YaaH